MNQDDKNNAIEHESSEDNTSENNTTENSTNKNSASESSASETKNTETHTTANTDTKTTEQSSAQSSVDKESCCDHIYCHSTNNTDKNNNSTQEKKWQNKNVWKRGLAMLGYGFVAGFVRMAITFIAIFQFFALLFTEKPNAPLVKFGQSLNTYLYQINQFLTVNSEIYPFPLADWPESSVKDK